MCPEKRLHQTAFDFWLILCKKPLQPSEIYPEKMFMPDDLRLPFHTDREAPQVACCDNSKKYGSGQPSAFGRSPAKSLSSLRRFTSKKCSGQTTSGRLLPTDREAPQVTRCDDPKKCSSGQPSAFGRSSAKSLSSVRRCTLKKCSCRTTFGCLSTPTERLPKWPAATTRKSMIPDSLRLLVNPLQKVSPASGNVPRKDVPARQPPAAFSQRPRGSPSDPLR